MMRSILRKALLSGVMLVTATIVVASGLAANAAAITSKSSAAAGPPCAAGTLVQTTTGPVCGIVVNGDSEWLGIPYAAPPVGSLRWAPPQPHAPWSTTLPATAFGSSCVQGSRPTQGSEDCLYLNVWQPPGATAASGLPVMVHIHGGGFFNGSGNGDNTLLANTGHEVVVSLNYRLNVLGFLAGSVLGAHSGDYGLQDQQAALSWVKGNIAAFGGDPNNVTIFGESAGGSSVCDQIASPTAAGLFQKAISTSGEYNTLFGGPEAPRPGGAEDLEVQDCKSNLPTQAQANSIGASFAAAVGCASAADVAACLRQVPVATVEQVANTPGDGYQYGGQGTIAPTLNGTTLPMTLRQALKTGAVNRVPVIAGTDRDEDLVGFPVTAAQYTQLVQAQYGPIAGQVLALYPLSSFYSPFVAFRTVAADSGTVCSSLLTDQALAKWMPVYGYEIDNGDPPGAATTPTGAAHVAAWNLTPTAGLDANMQVLQTQEVSDVTTFARTGNPSAQFTPTWPQFKLGEGASQEMSLAPGGDSQAMSVAQIELNHNCGFWDKVSP